MEIVNSCEAGNGGCSHGCSHTSTGPLCTCPRGYELDEDQKTCIGASQFLPGCPAPLFPGLAATASLGLVWCDDLEVSSLLAPLDCLGPAGAAGELTRVSIGAQKDSGCSGWHMGVGVGERKREQGGEEVSMELFLPVVCGSVAVCMIDCM